MHMTHMQLVHFNHLHLLMQVLIVPWLMHLGLVILIIMHAHVFAMIAKLLLE